AAAQLRYHRAPSGDHQVGVIELTRMRKNRLAHGVHNWRHLLHWARGTLWGKQPRRDGAHRAWSSLLVEQYERGRTLLGVEHRVGVGLLRVLRSCKQRGNRKWRNGHGFGIESRAGKQLKVILHFLLARGCGQHQRIVTRSSHPYERDRGTIDREGQMLFQREGNHLMELA